jgi:flagellar P-ring protein precursor FlgI
VLLAAPQFAWSVKVGDITHLQGSRTNRLVGMGLVVGLTGTGDGGRYAPTMRPLAQLYARFANPVASMEELKDAKNVAIVQLEAVLPEDGAREGERIDVSISSVGAAKSLAGGRLLLTPLVGPHPDDPRGVMAMAGGPLQLPDPATPTVARIAQGATLEQDWVHHYIALGRDLAVYRNTGSGRPSDWIRPDEPHVTLIIDDPHAEWGVAYTIAQSINEEATIPDLSAPVGPPIAMAFDPRTVVVRLPETERANPAPFLYRIENLALFLPYTEARVVIGRKSGSIVITGDVEISPAVITYKGLTITTVIPELPASPANPKIVEKDFVPIDPQKKGGAKLADLVDALNQLRVSAPDKINIIEQLHKTGKLHATVIVED